MEWRTTAETSRSLQFLYGGNYGGRTMVSRCLTPENDGRGGRIRTFDLLVPKQEISITYEHCLLKKRDLPACLVDLYEPRMGGFLALGPSFHVGNPRASYAHARGRLNF